MIFNSQDVSGHSAPQNEERLRLLVETGLLLASERSLDVIVQAALDAGLTLCGARFGAFFYNNAGEKGEPYRLYKLAGQDAAAFAAFPMPRPTQIFRVTFLDQGILRSDDITRDPRYGHNAPFAGVPPGHPSVHSFLSVPVRSRSGEVLGGMFFGHPDVGVFSSSSENLVATIASQAAVAMDNVRLSESLTREISLVNDARKLQRQTADRLREALDAAQLGTWSWDCATDLIELDERSAQFFHVKPHVPLTREQLSKELRDRVTVVEGPGKVGEDLRASLLAGGQVSLEYRVKNPDGTLSWITASGIANVNATSSDIISMVGTFQDITARKSQETALRQSEKLAAAGRLAATIAHEINNPLEAVTNLIYLSRTDAEVPPHVRELLKTADGELARVAQIAQQTLGFYRDTMHPVEVDINELLHAVVDLFARKMASARIVCTLDLEPGLRICGLQGEMRQVFSNLVVNAIDAFNSVLKPGRIRIRGRHVHGPHKGVSVIICDDGAGIPPAARARIFSPFFTTKESLGTGLGLWVTRGFVEKQGGSIHFRTRTAEPSGTIFRVFLPAEMPNVR